MARKRSKKRRSTARKAIARTGGIGRFKMLMLVIGVVLVLFIASGNDLFSSFSVGDGDYTLTVDFASVDVNPEGVSKILNASDWSVDGNTIHIDPDGAPQITTADNRGQTGYPIYDLTLSDFSFLSSDGSVVAEPVELRTDVSGDDKIVYYKAFMTMTLKTVTQLGSAGTLEGYEVNNIPAIGGSLQDVDLSIVPSQTADAAGMMRVYSVQRLDSSYTFLYKSFTFTSAEQASEIAGVQHVINPVGYPESPIAFNMESYGASARIAAIPGVVINTDGSVDVINVMAQIDVAIEVGIETSLYDTPRFTWGNSNLVFSTDQISLLFLGAIIILVVSIGSVWFIRRTRTYVGSFDPWRQKKSGGGGYKEEEFDIFKPTSWKSGESQPRGTRGRFVTTDRGNVKPLRSRGDDEE